MNSINLLDRISGLLLPASVEKIPELSKKKLNKTTENKVTGNMQTHRGNLNRWEKILTATHPSKKVYVQSGTIQSRFLKNVTSIPAPVKPWSLIHPFTLSPLLVTNSWDPYSPPIVKKQKKTTGRWTGKKPHWCSCSKKGHLKRINIFPTQEWKSS